MRPENGFKSVWIIGLAAILVRTSRHSASTKRYETLRKIEVGFEFQRPPQTLTYTEERTKILNLSTRGLVPVWG